MKVAYIFSSVHSQNILHNMIIPQLETDQHGVEVAGMFFFMDNVFFLLKNTQMGEKLQAIQEKTGMLLMACDQCVYQRGVEEKLIDSAHLGCFPTLYGALRGVGGVDQVITL